MHNRSFNTVESQNLLTNVINHWVANSVAKLNKNLGPDWCSRITSGCELSPMNIWVKLVLTSEGAKAIPKIRQAFHDSWVKAVSEL